MLTCRGQQPPERAAARGGKTNETGAHWATHPRKSERRPPPRPRCHPRRPSHPPRVQGWRGHRAGGTRAHTGFTKGTGTTTASGGGEAGWGGGRRGGKTGLASRVRGMQPWHPTFGYTFVTASMCALRSEHRMVERAGEQQQGGQRQTQTLQQGGRKEQGSALMRRRGGVWSA